MRRTRSLSRPAIRLGGALVACVLAGGAAFAQTTYKKPPREVVRMLETPPPPIVSVGPTGERAILLGRESMRSIEELAAPMLRLAGERINPVTNAPHMSYWSFVSMERLDLDAGRTTTIDTPEEAKIDSPSWAPDGSMIAFRATFPDRAELWVVDVDEARARRVGGFDLNSAITTGFEWMPDSETLLVATVPSGRGAPPEEADAPTGPVIQETSGRTSPVRTYQDLLEDEHDERLFEYYATAQLALVNALTGSTRPIGEPGLYRDYEPAPDGRHILTTRMLRPFSYLVPHWSFPDVVEVTDLKDGDRTVIARRPLRDQTPIGGVPTGRRSIEWKATSPATLMWAEALDGGDPKVEVPHRDALLTLSAPFTDAPTEFMRTEQRYVDSTWIERGDLAMISEYDRDRRWVKTWMKDLGDADALPTLVWDRSVRDRYNDPGDPVMKTTETGHSVAHVQEGAIFLTGRGATPQGDRPFLDRMDLQTLDTDRLWRNEGEVYERVTELLADDASRVLTSRESPKEPPNYYVRDLEEDEVRRVTDYTDPTADFQQAISKELVTYKRDDGVQLSATLYLPPDYRRGERLPLVVWAYPREFNDPSTAGQVSGSPYRYTRIGGSSHLFYLTQGYAVMDDAAMPVVGDDPETVNDTFIKQIVDSAEAAIRFAADRGVADPQRVGVGGHSYGAFMTANLLAHSDLFRAGVARSGAYNRTLTPFGFQAERRTFWEAPEVYFGLSPFMHADEIDEPILLVHGMIDNNSGTFPIQSERLYHAVKGHGGTARLVMLPHESHGYRAEESIMHVLAEMIEWFDRHVKNASATGAQAQ